MLQRLFNAFKPAVRPVSRPADGAPDPAVDIAHGLVLGGQSSAARGVLERRLGTNPDDADALALQGWVLFDLGESDQARAVLSRALQLAPGHVEVLNTLGALDADDPDPNLSVRWFRAALKSDPGNLGAQYNLAQKLFFLGEYEEGFRLLRARHRLHFKRDNPLEPLPMWQGENLAGKTAFVWCDWGGLGDHLLFVRYVALFRASANPHRVIAGVQPACARLFAGLPGIDEVIAPGVTPVADIHCPLLDLPYRLRTTANNVPGAGAYLHADPALIESWRSRIASQTSTNGRLRAGLVWGNDQRAAQAAHERVRLGKAVPPHSFAALANAGAAFFSLQLGATPDELAGTGLDLIDITGGIADFADTAAIIASLDLVISADTSVAHLAGALGKPVILLLSEAGGMLWPQQGRHTPWYPSMTIVRQQGGSWSGAIEQVRAVIGQMAGQPPR